MRIVLPLLSLKSILTITVLLFLAVLPVFLKQPFYINLIILSLMWAIVASNWDLLMGYAGIFSLAQMSFFTIGGYISGMMAKILGVSPWLGILCAGIFTAIISTIIIGLPTLRLRGIYVALFTIAFNQIVRISIISFGPYGITGGIGGLQSIPNLSIGAHSFKLYDYYYLILALFIISSLIIYRLLESQTGLAFIALRDNESYAISRGVNAYLMKISVFLVVSFLTGTAGAFYAHYIGNISVLKVGEISTMFNIFAMIIIGGWGRFPGPIIGAFAITFLSEFVLRYVEQYRLIILGLLEIIVIVVVPSGLIKILEMIREKVEDIEHLPRRKKQAQIPHTQK